MSDPIANPATLDAYSKLIPGDVTAIRACADWLDRLDRRDEGLRASLVPVFDAEELGEAARSTVFSRAQYQAERLARELECRTFDSVVSEEVSTCVRSLVDEAAAACRDLMTACKQERLPPPDELFGCLVRIQSPGVELRGLRDLLACALVVRGALPKPAVTAVATPPRWISAQEAAKLAEENFGYSIQLSRISKLCQQEPAPFRSRKAPQGSRHKRDVALGEFLEFVMAELKKQNDATEGDNPDEIEQRKAAEKKRKEAGRELD